METETISIEEHIEILNKAQDYQFAEGFKFGMSEAKLNFEKLIENERVYPDYQDFKIPAEAITQFKVKIKNR